MDLSAGPLHNLFLSGLAEIAKDYHPKQEELDMNRILTFVYGTATYLVFLAVFLYAIGFIGNFEVPKSMDSPADGPWQTALLIDLGLLALFAVQHSVMARPAF